MLLLRLNQITKRYVQLKAFPATVSGDGPYNSRARVLCIKLWTLCGTGTRSVRVLFFTVGERTCLSL